MGRKEEDIFEEETQPEYKCPCDLMGISCAVCPLNELPIIM